MANLICRIQELEACVADLKATPPPPAPLVKTDFPDSLATAEVQSGLRLNVVPTTTWVWWERDWTFTNTLPCPVLAGWGVDFPDVYHNNGDGRTYVYGQARAFRNAGAVEGWRGTRYSYNDNRGNTSQLRELDLETVGTMHGQRHWLLQPGDTMRIEYRVRYRIGTSAAPPTFLRLYHGGAFVTPMVGAYYA